MPKTISEYQEAFNEALENLKAKDSVAAIVVFGSIVNGDIWEKSDIDMMVISSEKQEKIVNIYSDYDGIPIHVRLIHKDELMNLCSGDNKGSHIHRLFSSSKLVYSKDTEIDRLYNEERFYSDIHREKWNVTFLSKLLKSVSECRKYLYMDSLYNAYTLCNIVLRDYSKLVVNSSGYIINRDIVTMAISTDEELSREVEQLFNDKDNLEKCIGRFIRFIEGKINENIRIYASIIIQYLRESDNALSSSEIRDKLGFKHYDINIEEILDSIYELNIINRCKRGYKTLNEETLIDENVYYL
ncbi:nucleotidyltransferase domain-containing protein [Hathewaya histolytica]|uniref:nucleotidyltransferase domain-containing protein n=1 Tax=Hathewaya histolytica TaxID=1498 RepID=UPI003B67762F